MQPVIPATTATPNPAAATAVILLLPLCTPGRISGVDERIPPRSTVLVVIRIEEGAGLASTEVGITREGVQWDSHNGTHHFLCTLG